MVDLLEDDIDSSIELPDHGASMESEVQTKLVEEEQRKIREHNFSFALIILQ